MRQACWWTTFATVLLITNTALAEVLDKLEFPWEASHYARMLLALGCACILAGSTRMYVRIAGLVMGLLWAMLSLWADPWFTTDIGNALRAELTEEQAARWLRTIMVQAWIPMGAALLVFLRRTRVSAKNQPSLH